ncbi:hypothetical protein [Ammonifex degensii]|nr:hypothetical protein [Ammonifex degensii]
MQELRAATAKYISKNAVVSGEVVAGRDPESTEGFAQAELLEVGTAPG